MTPHDRDGAGGPGAAPDAQAWELIADYLTDQLAPEARAAFERRVEHDEALRACLDDARRVWESVDPALRVPVTKEQLDRGWERLHRATVGLRQPERVISLRPRRRAAWPVALAASMVLTLGIGVTALSLRNSAPDAVVLAAEPGRQAQATLADGTRVRLAPGSELVYPERFAGDERIVRLSGRAFFDVAHDAERPFIVHAGGAVTRVLGTEFDVRAFGGTATQVVVRSGRVAVNMAGAPADRSRVLGPGDRGVIDPSGSIDVESGVDVEAITGWTRGYLVFRRSTLTEVAAELEHWYDVRIEVPAALGARRVTASFEGEPLPVVLQTLGQLVDARVEQDGRTVRFSLRDAPAEPASGARNFPSPDGGETP
jgi:transmembrane sensor